MSDIIKAAIIAGEARVYAVEFAHWQSRKLGATASAECAQHAAAAFTRWIEMRHSLDLTE